MCNEVDEHSVREGYDELGVDDFYRKHQEDYSNPHIKIVQELIHIGVEKGYINGKILDLCCGSGEVTSSLDGFEITGLDPYTAPVYHKKTGKNALEYTFKDIAMGKLEGMKFDTIICSFALHLCEESMLSRVLWGLGEISKCLIILTPHKRPDCDQIAEWYLVDEIILKRVRMRVYYR